MNESEVHLEAALARCRATKPLKHDVAAWLVILNSILRKDGSRIDGALKALVLAHEREARRRTYPERMWWGYCNVALGLTAVAVRAGLVTVKDLPPSQFLPYAWITHEGRVGPSTRDAERGHR